MTELMKQVLPWFLIPQTAGRFILDSILVTVYVIATCFPNDDVDEKDKGLISLMIKMKANKSLKSVTHTHGLRKSQFLLFVYHLQ